MSKIGVVAIGRNEGERLQRCLRSVTTKDRTVIYVDSGSTDQSVMIAHSMGVDTVRLDMSLPFTAARSRNAGFEHLRLRDPSAEFVFFIDGDCEMRTGWLAQACKEMDRRQDVAIVSGRLRERFPHKSIFNRLADLEWDCPLGDVAACGGIFVVRAQAFAEVGGFDVSIIAGEEPELCWRLRQRNWKIVRLPDEMAWHDLAMHRFRQWWKREIRNGSGAFDIWSRTGRRRDGPFFQQVRSARRWGLIWPTATLILPLLGWFLGGSMCAAVLLAFGVLLWLVQVARIAVQARQRDLYWPESIMYGLLIMIGKWAQLYGRFSGDRQRRRLEQVRIGVGHKLANNT